MALVGIRLLYQEAVVLVSSLCTGIHVQISLCQAASNQLQER